MMPKYMFEIRDKTNRLIHLSKERWEHIRTEHQEITSEEPIKEALLHPRKIIASDRDNNVQWYLIYNKKNAKDISKFQLNI